jgi:cytochrome b561
MKYILKFRVWHWLNAFVIFGLLGTVFLRKTFLSWRDNSQIIISQFNEFGIEVTQEQAKIVAKAIRAGMWDWHIILGYALAFLVLYRIYLAFKDNSQRELFSDLEIHKKAVKVLYGIFYIVLFGMSVSGFIIYFYQDIGLSKDFAHNIKEMHESVSNFIWFFVALHIAGVVVAEVTNDKGLVSTMIHGDKYNY